jgi:hypothetical protein
VNLLAELFIPHLLQVVNYYFSLFEGSDFDVHCCFRVKLHKLIKNFLITVHSGACNRLLIGLDLHIIRQGRSLQRDHTFGPKSQIVISIDTILGHDHEEEVLLAEHLGPSVDYHYYLLHFVACVQEDVEFFVVAVVQVYHELIPKAYFPTTQKVIKILDKVLEDQLNHLRLHFRGQLLVKREFFDHHIVIVQEGIFYGLGYIFVQGGPQVVRLVRFLDFVYPNL